MDKSDKGENRISGFKERSFKIHVIKDSELSHSGQKKRLERRANENPDEVSAILSWNAQKAVKKAKAKKKNKFHF